MAALLLIPLSANAQENDTSVILPLTMPCDTSDKIFDILQNKYNEEPVGIANGTIYDNGGKPRMGQIVIWRNSKGTSYTITFTPLGTDVMCFLSTGKEMQILPKALGDAI